MASRHTVHTAWPFVRGKRSPFLYEGVWIVYCQKCGEVMGTKEWCDEHQDEMYFKGCTGDSGAHDIWNVPLPSDCVLVVWKECKV